MRTLILGAGAIGGYMGARLIESGGDVTLLARGNRLAHLQRDGLIVESPLCNVSVPAPVDTSRLTREPPHLIVIACKAPALESALSAISPFVGDGTRLLPILNGVAHLDVLRRRFPGAIVLGGLTHGALTLRADGVIAHLSPFFSVTVGLAPRGRDAVADDFVQLFSSDGAAARASGHILQDMWNKFVFLTTLAAATCLMRSSVGTILATNDGRAIMSELLDECRTVARAEGFEPDAAAMAPYAQSLMETGSPLTASMLRDINNGFHTEADHIVGDMLKRARKHSIPAPILRLAYTHLQCHEANVG